MLPDIKNSQNVYDFIQTLRTVILYALLLYPTGPTIVKTKFLIFQKNRIYKNIYFNIKLNMMDIPKTLKVITILGSKFYYYLV
jgi:hypothetical protein